MTTKPSAAVKGICHRPLVHDGVNHKVVMTLEEAVKVPRQHREDDVHNEPMPNFKSTPTNPPHELPLSFWASWELNSRPRRMYRLVVR
jgi:hypothetical protein